MGNFGRDDRGGRSSFGGGRRSFGGGDRGGFSRGGGYGGGRGGSSFGRNDDRPREMFDAVCDNCGKPCQVPFKPTSGKPVYCSDCFEKMGGREGRSEGGQNDRPSFDRPRFENRAPVRAPREDNQNKLVLDSLNAKLDKIISLLEPKVVETIKTEVMPKKVKKATKIKKSVETPII